MKKRTIKLLFKNRRIKWTLLLFIAALLILSTTTLSQKETNINNIAAAQSTNEIFSERNKRAEDFELRARGFLDEKRHREAEEYGAKVEKAKGSIIAVDAGHGGQDCGTGYDGLEEKDINLDISLKLGEKLKEAGIKVVYTRETDEYIGLNKRASMANNAGADLFISVHCNGMEDDTSCNGSETLYKNKKTEVGKVDSKRLAEIVQGELAVAIGTKDNGIKYRNRLAVLVATHMPAVIAEVGYISNYSDREKLGSEEYREKAAEALFKAVIKAINEMK